jgi:hypothetical protein
MRRLLAKNPAGSIRSIDVTRPPTSTLQRDDGTVDRSRFSARDVWLVVTVPAVASSETPPVYEIPLWKGEIFAAAVQTEMRRAAVREPAMGLRVVAGFTVSEVDHSGRRTHSDTVLTTGNSGGDFVTSDATVRRDVAAQLASQGIKPGSRGAIAVESITLFEGVDPAPIVRLRLRSATSSPRSTLASDVGAGSTYEGYLLIVDGPNGAPIQIGANVERAAYGSSWADPRYIKTTGDPIGSLHG